MAAEPPSTLLRRSAIADAAALRWEESHADELEVVSEPALPVTLAHAPVVRASAIAEGAALRWLERHPDEPGL